MDVITNFAGWINHAIAAYLEDIADAAEGRNFSPDELLPLGAHAASVMANIIHNFLKLTPPDREKLIAVLQNEEIPE